MKWRTFSRRSCKTRGAQEKALAVAEGEEGQPYDAIVKGRKITVDSSDGLHYLASKDNRIYLVEETLQ